MYDEKTELNEQILIDVLDQDAAGIRYLLTTDDGDLEFDNLDSLIEILAGYLAKKQVKEILRRRDQIIEKQIFTINEN